MLVAQATDQRTLRGVAHVADDAAAVARPSMTRSMAARLVVTVEQGEGVAPWQGIVPLDGDSLAACLAHYFEVSEQLPTDAGAGREHRCGRRPAAAEVAGPGRAGRGRRGRRQDLWEEAIALLATLGADELLTVEPELLLRRLFGAHDLRLFEGRARGASPAAATANGVAALVAWPGARGVESILAEQGAVTVTCEFCQKPYRFDAVDAARLFLPASAEGNASLN